MSEVPSNLTLREYRLLRRLARLFRIERKGGFARRTAPLAARLIHRRGLLLDQLVAIEIERNDSAAAPSRELRGAVDALAQEIERARRSAETRLAMLRADLRALGGEGIPTGMRNRAAGRVIGRG